MLLTTITVLIAMVHLGILNIPIALAIAACKASVVALYFMHLKTDGRRDPYLYVAALFPILLLLILSCALMPDIAFHQGDAVRFLKPGGVAPSPIPGPLSGQRPLQPLGERLRLLLHILGLGAAEPQRRHGRLWPAAIVEGIHDEPLVAEADHPRIPLEDR